MLKHARPYRFPPLAQVLAQAQPGSAPGLGDVQAALTQGFQEGLDKGYQEGLASGRADGQAHGLQEGLAQGRQQALDQARAEARARWAALATPVDALMQALRQQRAEEHAALRQDVVDLVAKVARQVIRCELTLQPVQLLSLVEETLTALPPTRDDEVEVFLNPEELERIRELDPTRAARWQLRADPALEAGECRVQAAGREADAGCRQRLGACMAQVQAQLGPDDDAPLEAAA
ncbi:flagellar assembly protein FliH [Ideonella oryzae]|uniref:Flagellar assembly protein FliH n=1 Tax=Ideonella oryzae TaxID=2937441 RepID=A0ABT1BLG6_9BURK|nr:flagellar assembly protein FliH [Ideonella oryzae]MCO5977064.1 flagellar assembly protein H [Ideonella oryzae]